MTTHTGGPAFPVTSDNYANPNSEGMTLRDYFAAQAMQSLIVVYNDDKHLIDAYARRAFEIADAMMKARAS